MENKNIFAKNLTYYRKLHKKSRKDVCTALGISYYTYSDWENGKKYPRMDKVERLANYFGILKSDLIEEKTEEREEMQIKNDILANIIVRLRTDEAFFETVEALHKLDPEKLSGLSALLK